MLVENALFKILKTNAALIALIQTRVYPGVLPQTVEYPAIAYRRVGKEKVKVLDPSGTLYDLVKYRFRFFATSKGADKYGEAKKLEKLIEFALDFQGTVIDDTVSPVESYEIQGIFPETSFDQYDDKTQTHQAVSDFSVWGEDDAQP